MQYGSDYEKVYITSSIDFLTDAVIPLKDIFKYYKVHQLECLQLLHEQDNDKHGL